ncbi:MAG: type II secretion system F family protein [Candidatus Omnitrophica bacterium]|nr:type II secretion system F family protein [Candidatus Omnitrophota bacterium]
MLTATLILVFLSISLLIVGLSPVAKDDRPSLNLKDLGISPLTPQAKVQKQKVDRFFFLNGIALIVKPLISPEMRKRLTRDLMISQTDLTPEAFMLIKLVLTGALIMLLSRVVPPDLLVFGILMAVAIGYIGPEMVLRSRIGKIKDDIVRLLPDSVDLLGLCVNAGLDFMMALKWVVEKSADSVVNRELNNILQEISVGKPRREALRDLAKKYELPDLSTFARTLIQADKMGTSVSEALNILSEDMRLARFRRGEAMALKAPLKMLIPLLFFIFPVVFILVGAPIFLDFVMNNPLGGLGK